MKKNGISRLSYFLKGIDLQRQKNIRELLKNSMMYNKK